MTVVAYLQRDWKVLQSDIGLGGVMRRSEGLNVEMTTFLKSKIRKSK